MFLPDLLAEVERFFGVAPAVVYERRGPDPRRTRAGRAGWFLLLGSPAAPPPRRAASIACPGRPRSGRSFRWRSRPRAVWVVARARWAWWKRALVVSCRSTPPRRSCEVATDLRPSDRHAGRRGHAARGGCPAPAARDAAAAPFAPMAVFLRRPSTAAFRPPRLIAPDERWYRVPVGCCGRPFDAPGKGRRDGVRFLLDGPPRDRGRGDRFAGVREPDDNWDAGATAGATTATAAGTNWATRPAPRTSRRPTTRRATTGSIPASCRRNLDR